MRGSMGMLCSLKRAKTKKFPETGKIKAKKGSDHKGLNPRISLLLILSSHACRVYIIHKLNYAGLCRLLAEKPNLISIYPRSNKGDFTC